MPPAMSPDLPQEPTPLKVIEEFDGRFAMCPLCRRDNVRLCFYAGSVVFDEHPVPIVVIAHPVPIDSGARFNPRAMEASYARVRCPASLAPLVQLEDP